MVDILELHETRSKKYGGARTRIQNILNYHNLQ